MLNNKQLSGTLCHPTQVAQRDFPVIRPDSRLPSQIAHGLDAHALERLSRHRLPIHPFGLHDNPVGTGRDLTSGLALPIPAHTAM